MNIQKQVLFIDDKSKTLYYSISPYDHAHLTNAYWIPAIGYEKFDGHIYVSGATNSGKSFLIKKITMNDKKKRQCILFTDLNKDDPSLIGIDYEKYNDRNEKDEFISPFESDWLKEKETNKIMIFDDVQFNKDIIKYRDYMLEKGRHNGNIVICVNHKLQDYFATKVPLNDSRFVVTFPCSNRGAVFRYLKDEFEIERRKLNEILDIACKEGRHLIIHKFHPVTIATTESIIKL